jgi:hypothetical protein
MALVALLSGINVLIGGASKIPGASEAVEATIDNELRFFSVFWSAYGIFCFWVAKNIHKQSFFIPYIALVFFIGGIGRLISMLTIGLPASVLIPIMILEFIIPIILYGIYRRVYKKNIHAIQSENESK